MTRSILRSLLLGWFGVLCARELPAVPVNDNFDDRISLAGSHVATSANNVGATREAGEPALVGNPGGKSVWWTWMAPENGTVIVKTAGSDFDTLLGVFTGSSVAGLTEVASGDDTLGPEPLTSLVSFHAPSGAVYQIVVDGYRGDFGDVAAGNITLSLDFIFDRYTVTLGVNDTNRGSAGISPLPDPDGKFLVNSMVTVAAEPMPGWYFDSWSGDFTGTNNPAPIVLRGNMNITANFSPVLVRTLRRSPASITRFNTQGAYLEDTGFKVWNTEAGTLNYEIKTDAAWLQIQPTTGSVRGETNSHFISFNLSGLRVGNYVGTILISPLVEGGQPQSVVVALRVDPLTFSPQWQYSFISGEPVRSLEQTSDGGYMIFGFGSVQRLDQNGSNVWTQSFSDDLSSLFTSHQTAEGGFLLAGGFAGDFAITRLNAAGNKLWERTFGGTNSEQLAVVRQTADHGFILAGSSSSGPSGNKVSENFGSYDFWIVRLDANGKRLWDKSFGGTNYDVLMACDVNAAGEILLAGNSRSGASGNKTNENYGLWTIKLDASGNKIEERVLNINSDYFPLVQFAPDGGLVLVGGSGVGLVLRTDAYGNVLWQTVTHQIPFYFGWRFLNLQQTPDGGFRVYSQIPLNFSSQLEAIQLSASGEMLWRRKLFRSFPSDMVKSTSDGGVLLAGYGSGHRVVKLMPPPAPPDRSVYSSFGFRFFASGESNHLQVTDYSANLADWTPLQTNLLQESELEIFDTSATNAPTRFYRTRPAP